MSRYLCSAVVLLGEKRHDSGCNDVARPVGGAACCLQQLGTWPHEFQVWLTQVMLAVWNNMALSKLETLRRDNSICLSFTFIQEVITLAITRNKDLKYNSSIVKHRGHGGDIS